MLMHLPILARGGLVEILIMNEFKAQFAKFVFKSVVCGQVTFSSEILMLFVY